MYVCKLYGQTFANFTGKKLEKSYDSEYEIFRALLLYEHEHTG